jgi:hypothetical protein
VIEVEDDKESIDGGMQRKRGNEWRQLSNASFLTRIVPECAVGLQISTGMMLVEYSSCGQRSAPSARQ